VPNESRSQQQQQQPSRRLHSDEIKQEAIRLAIEHGMTCDAISAKLNAPPKTIANWVRPLRRQNRLKQIDAGLAVDDPAAMKAQIAALQKENHRLRQERDILKKFSQYAAGQMPGGLQ
jgi:transposase